MAVQEIALQHPDNSESLNSSMSKTTNDDGFFLIHMTTEMKIGKWCQWGEHKDFIMHKLGSERTLGRCSSNTYSLKKISFRNVCRCFAHPGLEDPRDLVVQVVKW